MKYVTKSNASANSFTCGFIFQWFICDSEYPFFLKMSFYHVLFHSTSLLYIPPFFSHFQYIIAFYTVFKSLVPISRLPINIRGIFRFPRIVGFLGHHTWGCFLFTGFDKRCYASPSITRFHFNIVLIKHFLT